MPKKVVMAAMYRCGKAIPVAISHEIQALTQSYYHLKTTPELVYNPVDVSRYSKLEKKKRKNFTLIWDYIAIVLHLQPLPGAGLESLSSWPTGRQLFPEI